MDPLTVVRQRLAQQRLAGTGFDRPDQVVRWLGAVQAQEHAEAKWSLAERLHDRTDTEVQQALDRGEIIRTHVLRPTWHDVDRDDLRWLLRLTRPRVHALNGHMYRQEGLDADLFARADDVLAEAIASEGPRTRPELQQHLARAGIEAERFRLGYLVMHAELEEVVCSGPMRGKQQTYALVDDRVPHAPHDDRPRPEAVAELVRRYVTSHGPATVRDFRAWSSLTLTEIRAGLDAVADDLELETDEAGTDWYSARTPAPVPSRTGAFLVPMYDETIVAYQDLRVVMAQDGARAGDVERAVVVEGRTVGTWRRTLTARAVVVEVRMFGGLDDAEAAALEAVVERFGRFLGVEASLRTTTAP